MRDKHIHIADHSALLKRIYREVDSGLSINKARSAALLWAKFLVYASLAGLSYTCLFVVQDPLIFLGCFILYGLLAVLFAFNFAHDFSHHTVFKSRLANHLGFVALYTLVGAHAEAWKYRHIHSHHYAPNVEGYDSDLSISSLIRVTPTSRQRWFHRFQHWYAPLAYTTYSLFWVFVKDPVLLFEKAGSPKKSLAYHLSFWLQKCFYVTYMIALPLIFSLQSTVVVIAGFLLMHLCQSVFLLFTFFITHHVESTAYPVADAQGYINESWLMNQVKSSNDFYPFSPAANFIFGGFNNHVAHHLFPHIHHVHYPRLNRILFPILQEHGVQPNVTGFFSGIVSHLRLLKQMGATGKKQATAAQAHIHLH